ncbi:hypothetical protein K2P96_00025 [Patescibacteria group bacterium]|nr:hypothetical protein [Patescibacteria group bacterium]
MAVDGRTVDEIIDEWGAIAAKVERPAKTKAKKAKGKKSRTLPFMGNFLSRPETALTPEQAKELITQQLFDIIVAGTEDLKLVNVYYAILARIDDLPDPTQLKKANLEPALRVFQKNSNHKKFNFFRGIMLRADLSKDDPQKAVGILRGDSPISKKLFTINYWPRETTKEIVKKDIADAFNIAFHDEIIRNQCKEVILQSKIIPSSDSEILKEIRVAFGIKNTIASMFFPESAVALKKLFGDPINVEVEKLNSERSRLMNEQSKLQEEAHRKLITAQEKYDEEVEASRRMDSKQKEMWIQCITGEQGTWGFRIEEYSEILQDIFPIEVIIEYRRLLFSVESEINNGYTAIDEKKSFDIPLLQDAQELSSYPIPAHSQTTDPSEDITPTFSEFSQNSTSLLAIDDSIYTDNSEDEEPIETTPLISNQSLLGAPNKPSTSLNTPKNSPIDEDASGFVDVPLNENPPLPTTPIISRTWRPTSSISIPDNGLPNPRGKLFTPSKGPTDKHLSQQEFSDEEKHPLLVTDETELGFYERAQHELEEEAQPLQENQRKREKEKLTIKLDEHKQKSRANKSKKFPFFSALREEVTEVIQSIETPRKKETTSAIKDGELYKKLRKNLLLETIEKHDKKTSHSFYTRFTTPKKKKDFPPSYIDEEGFTVKITETKNKAIRSITFTKSIDAEELVTTTFRGREKENGIEAIVSGEYVQVKEEILKAAIKIAMVSGSNSLVLEVKHQNVSTADYCLSLLDDGIIPVFAHYEKERDNTAALWKTFNELCNDEKTLPAGKQFLKNIFKEENILLKKELIAGLFYTMSQEDGFQPSISYEGIDYTAKNLETADELLVKKLICSQTTHGSKIILAQQRRSSTDFHFFCDKPPLAVPPVTPVTLSIPSVRPTKP